jgi:hypothetical protein
MVKFCHLGGLGCKVLATGSKSIYSVAFWDEELFGNDAYVHLWEPDHFMRDQFLNG